MPSKNRANGSRTHTQDDGFMDGCLELVLVLPQPHDRIVGVLVVATQLLQPLVADILNVPQFTLRLCSKQQQQQRERKESNHYLTL